MGAMYRLKAYFGMVPAEDMAEYADEPPVERYAGRRREYPGDRWSDGDPAAERDLRDVRVADDRSADRYDDDWDRRPVREPSRPMVAERPREVVSRLDREPVRGVVGAGSSLGSPAVRGALAMDTDALREPALRDQTLRDQTVREPARLPERTPAPAVPEQRPRCRASPRCSRAATTRPARSASATATASR